jgi:transcriptional regulator with GAF, ATPase, and Fis domain
LRLIADMIGSTLRRIEVATDLRRSLDEIRRLTERLEEENRHLRDEIAVTRRPDGIVGESPGLQHVLAQVAQVAPTGATVLLTGETGSGKEVVASAIHRQSDRCDRPMIKVNCAALPPTLIEGELFGREKGAFTGATTRQAGRFEVADGSTLFLDEICDLPLELQAKLLHVLQDGALTRLGSNKTIKVDVRVIAATNRNLAEAVRARRFREDLFYRLNVFPIEVPPLRQRREDIIPLTWAFVDEFSRAMGKKISRLPKATADAIVAYDWPGNVRELRNVVERAMILARGEDLLVALPDADGGTAEIELSLDTAQRRHIIDVLERVGWRVGGAGGAAALLGLPRSTLRARMRKLGIAPQSREEIARADPPRSI